MSSLWPEMYAERGQTFVNTSADMTFKFQWHIEKHLFKALDLGAGLTYMPTMRLITCEVT